MIGKVVSNAIVRIVGDNAPLKNSLNESRGFVQGFLSNIGQGIAQGIGQRVFDTLANSVRAGVRLIGQSVADASNLAETISATNTVFGESAEAIQEWSQTSATSLGLTRQEALQTTTQLGNMFQQLGAGSRDAAQLSTGMVELAADIASFHNVAGGAAEVSETMQAAFRGEYDSVQRYIPVINAAVVEQRALADTGKENAKQLTALDKALAVHALIMEGAGAATGDFARTSGGLANQQRILSAQLRDTSAEIGQAFTPALAVLTRNINDLIRRMRPYGTNIMVSFINGLNDGLRGLIPFIRQLRQFFIEWLRPGSPPKIAPDLDKWGKEAMEVYLSGFANFDQSIFRNLGSSLERVIRSFTATGQADEGDMVSRILGSEAAIADAIREFRELGQVSSATINRIVNSAGSAGAAVGNMVREFFRLQEASQAVRQAQEKLNAVTEKYQKMLAPVQGAMSENQREQQAIRDRMRIAELQAEIADASTTADERRLAQLEIEEIQLRQQQDALENNQQVEEEAAQAALEAAEAAQAQAKAQYDAAQAIIDQQVRTNELLLEEQERRERLIQEARQRAEEEKRRVEEYEAEQERLREEEKRREEERLEALERLRQAQLAYQMAMADPEGRLALLQGELARTETNTPEYYQLLIQIAAAEEEVARARQMAEEERARAEQEAADAAERARQAQLDYNMAVADTPERIRLLREELGRTTEGSEDYYRILTQIHQEEERLRQEQEQSSSDARQEAERVAAEAQRAAEEAQRQAETQARALEQLRQAQLAYNLLISDTPGKLTLLKDELGRYSEGSVEYYDILGQIYQLEQDLVSEREAAAGATSPIQNIMDLAEEAVGEEGPISELSKAGQDLADTIEEIFNIFENPQDIELPPSWQNAVDEIGGLTDAIEEVSPAFRGFVDFLREMFGIGEEEIETSTGNIGTHISNLSGTANTATADADRETGRNLSNLAGKFRLAHDNIKAIGEGDWARVWRNIRTTSEVEMDNAAREVDEGALAAQKNLNATATWLEGFATGDWRMVLDGLRKEVGAVFASIAWLMPGEGGSEPKDATSPLRGLKGKGEAIWVMVSEGLRVTNPLVSAWMDAIWWLHDQLPGSEPKDTSSPLYGLGDAGAAIITNIADGIRSAWTTFQTEFWDIFDDIADIANPDSDDSPLGDLYDHGVAIIDNLWDGVKAKWTEVENWWRSQMSWLAGFLPGSEPRNPQSPLRGLAARGEAIIGNLQQGIDRAQLDLEKSLTPNIGALAGATGGGAGAQGWNIGPIYVTIDNAQGPITPETGKDMADEFIKRVRQKGMRVR